MKFSWEPNWDGPKRQAIAGFRMVGPGLSQLVRENELNILEFTEKTKAMKRSMEKGARN